MDIIHTNERMRQQLADFFDVYSALTAQGKAAFQVQIGSVLAKSDERTRKIYAGMINAAENKLSIPETIESLKKELSLAKNNEFMF
ncbi:hypothetical protein A2310_08405 [candidate division WOR-1 bacterium RIFOXYB2_FULL_37_13]|uniref:Uncharacterized protein n=1 Tax=candidate division WOR-1 bacterium RIFOXYB2_FULL_37_13 TaxID=1802579 RepID=A0A1F4SVG1_UNCSA|nr:MAG: hypothetical protein A2310_08405 [candidate division WOR-1 bacterium RIFOXYB2_FULL_37_13]